jgi:hypothetical protein
MSTSLVLSKDPIHFGDFVQGKKAAPHDSRSRRAVVLAIQIAAELGNPQHDLSPCLLPQIPEDSLTVFDKGLSGRRNPVWPDDERA